jgi:methylated-DNA-[protein]-cysteine S-methyltransferase
MSRRGTPITERVVIPSPIAGCNLALLFSDNTLTKLDFVVAAEPLLAPQSDAAVYAVAQLELYWRNPHWPFDLPLLPQGSEFQQRVWQALREIPAGSTVTYGQLAWRLESSARAVGSACRANPVPIIVPCHRVVAATGVGGFMGQLVGQQIAIKEWLLQHERQAVDHDVTT